MDDVLDASTSMLIAQVRKADASHKIDTTHQLLRGKHFSGPNKVVYLGDVAKALLAQLAHPDTPVFTEAPGYNEQRWTLVTNSGDLRVEVQSLPYWGWGLLTSGYLNLRLPETQGRPLPETVQDLIKMKDSRYIVSMSNPSAKYSKLSTQDEDEEAQKHDKNTLQEILYQSKEKNFDFGVFCWTGNFILTKQNLGFSLPVHFVLRGIISPSWGYRVFHIAEPSYS